MRASNCAALVAAVLFSTCNKVDRLKTNSSTKDINESAMTSANPRGLADRGFGVLDL